MIETVPLNLDHYFKNGEIIREETLLIALFEPKGGQTSIYTSPLKLLKESAALSKG